MKIYKKFGAMAFIIAGLLNTFRILPILITPGVTPEQIPPHTLIDTVHISQTTAYVLSHIMALLATPLVIIAFYSLYKEIKLSNKHIAIQAGLLGLVGLTIGQLLYSLGLIVDGFALPTFSNLYIQTATDNNSQLGAIIMSIHQLAMSLAGVGFFSLLVSTGIYGYALFMGSFNKELSLTAITIGCLAIIGYLTGALDILIAQKFELTYGLLTLMYLFFLVVGVFQLKSVN